MNPAAFFAACCFAGGGVLFFRYPDRLYALRHQQMAIRPKLSTEGRRQFEFASVVWFFFAFAFLVLTFAD